MSREQHRTVARLVAGLFLALWLALPRTAQAAWPPSPCDAVSTLSVMSENDRTFIRELCERGEKGGAKWKLEAATDERRRLGDVIERALAGPPWVSAVVAAVLPAAVFTEVSSQAKCAVGSSDVYRGTVRKTLEQHIAYRTRRKPTDPLANFVVPSASSCSIETRAAGVEQSGVLLTVFTRRGEEVRILYAEKTSGLLRLVSDASSGGQTPSSELDVWFVRLPVNARYVMTAHPVVGAGDAVQIAQNVAPDVLDVSTARYPLDVWQQPGPTSCLDIQLAIEAPDAGRSDVVLYIDGFPASLPPQDDSSSSSSTGGHAWAKVRGTIPVAPHPKKHRVVSLIQWLPNTTHQLTVVQGEASTKTVLLEREVAPQSDALLHRCQAVRHDLRKMEAKKLVGLLDVSAPMCEQAGVDPLRMQEHLEAYFRAHERTANDVKAWGATVDRLGEFRKGLELLGGGAAGADRGNEDSIRALSTGAHELVRQGFESLLSVRVTCIRKRASDWDFSVIATRVDLEKLKQAVRDPLTGIDITNVLSSRIELVPERTGIAEGIDLAVARLFDFTEIAILDRSDYRPFQPDLAIPVRVSLGADVRGAPKGASLKGAPREGIALVLSQRPLTTDESPTLCADVQGTGELAGTVDRGALEGDADDWSSADPVVVPQSEHSRALLFADPQAPGRLLVRVELRRSHGRKKEHLGSTLATRYACVDLSRPRIELSIDGGLLTNLDTSRSARARGESLLSYALFGTMEWQQRFWNPLFFGVAIGFSHTDRDGLRPPNWDDVRPGIDYDTRGNLPYTVRENAGYFGFSSRVRSDLCSLFSWCTGFGRRVLASTRLHLLGGLHVIDKGEVDARLTFRRGSTETVFDATVLVEPSVGVEIDSVRTINLRGLLGYSRIFDLVRDANSADVFRGALFGASLGVSWGLE